MIRLIASDLDGTLLKGNNVIHPDNLAALREAMAKGVHFAVASGRAASSCSLLMRDHGLMEASILGTNGCQVMDRPYGKLLEVHHMRQDAAIEIARIGNVHGLIGCLYTEDAIVYSHKEMYEFEVRYHKENYVQDLAEAGARLAAGMDEFEAALHTTPMKIFYMRLPGQDEKTDAAYEAARRECAAVPGVELTSSWHDNFEVMPEGVSKGTALKELAERLGIARDEVMAFGDNDNDLAMLKWAGHGYAMGNSHPDVLAAIPLHTGHCTDGGVAQVIRRLVLA